MSELLNKNVVDIAMNVSDDVVEGAETQVDDNAKGEDEKDNAIQDEATDGDYVVVCVVICLVNLFVMMSL